jgi:hypothetical protein
VPGLLPVRFSRLLAEPAVPVSQQRALHGICRQAWLAGAQGLGILLPRYPRAAAVINAVPQPPGPTRAALARLGTALLRKLYPQRTSLMAVVTKVTIRSQAASHGHLNRRGIPLCIAVYSNWRSIR